MNHCAFTASGRYHADCEQIEIYQQGYCYWNEGNFAAARTCFAQLVSRNPLDRRFLFAFACALEVEGETLHALNMFLYVLHMKENDPWVYFHIAGCLQRLGLTVEARGALEATLKITDSGMAEQTDYGHLQQRAQALLNQLAY